MNFKKLVIFAALIVTGFIQMGCGSSNQNLANSNLAVGTMPYATNATACTYGQSYQNVYNYCQVGYVNQGNQCVCQSTTSNGAQGSCATGFIQTNYGCFQQGPCQQGYAYITPYAACIRY